MRPTLRISTQRLYRAYALRRQTLLHRADGRGRPGRDAQLLEDVLDVVARGLRRDVERGRDLLVREAAREQAQDLDLAIREAMRAVDLLHDVTGGGEHRSEERR